MIDAISIFNLCIQRIFHYSIVGTTYYHSGILSTLTQATANKIAGIKTNRYRRQAKVADRIFIAEPDPDSLYNALLMVAKGYVQLNRIVQPPI